MPDAYYTDADVNTYCYIHIKFIHRKSKSRKHRLISDKNSFHVNICILDIRARESQERVDSALHIFPCCLRTRVCLIEYYINVYLQHTYVCKYYEEII